MYNDPFIVDFNRLNIVALSFIPAIVNLIILSYTTLYSPKTRVNIFFSSFVLALAIWQIMEGFMRMSKVAEVASQWHRLSEISVLFVIFFGNLFVFRFTGFYKKIPNKIIFILFVLPILIFFIALNLRLDSFTIKQSVRWYWITNPEPTTLTLLNSVWVSLGALSMLLLLWYYYFNSKKNSPEQKKLLWMACGFSFPVIGGIVTEIVFPLVFKIDSIPTTNSLVTTFSITSIIVIRKYKMFSYSPKHQWDKIIETLNEGILIVNNKDEIMYANRAFCEATGYEFSEINGVMANKLFFPKEELISSEGETKLKNEGHTQIEIQTKNGDKRWMIVSDSSYTDRKGKIIGSIKLHTDISQIRKTKENLKSANTELEIYVYKASHDLRGPLASILGLIGVGRMEIKDQTALKYLEMLDTSAKKLDTTLAELVKGMKIKEIHVFDDVINFEDIISGVLKMFEHYPGYIWLKVSLNISVPNDFISNRFIIETIFQNLIENAIKYQNLKEDNSMLQIEVLQENNKVKIRVEDNGIGIDPSFQEKIFDMYFRGTDASTGSGLGLYLVKKSVDKLNGHIRLTSQPNQGAIFYVTLHNTIAA
ncbi:MAG: PAS domain S-box protein [Bacteroidetes bacterium]|nr:PAS domain S-box protein [Bacteroidota bacterium]